jgi:hypothetical protein
MRGRGRAVTPPLTSDASFRHNIDYMDVYTYDISCPDAAVSHSIARETPASQAPTLSAGGASFL